MSFKKPITNQARLITSSESSYSEYKPDLKLRLRNYNSDWIFILICFCFTLFAFVNTIYKKRVLQLIKAFWTTSYLAQLVKAENILMKQASLLLSVLFLFSFSLFSYQLLQHYYKDIIPYKGLQLYFLIMLSIVSFYTAKTFSFKLISFIFNTPTEIKEYTFNVFLITQTMGLFLLPLVVLLSYLPQTHHGILFLIGLFLILVLFLYRIVKGLFSLWFSSTFSKSYLFLYLCTLEILPVLLIGKFISNKYQLW